MIVNVEKLINNFNLEIMLKGEDNKNIILGGINRPGLQLTGFYDYFDEKRVQIIGKTEYSYLESLSPEIRKERMNKFFSYDAPCTIITRSLEIHKEVLEAAEKHNSWVLRTDMKATRFVSKLTNFLDIELAPETRIHGVLVDVYGIGILIIGESGIGKSETALELIKRGHRLIADDAVDIKEIDGFLYGSCPYITQGMLEVRGMGIIDVPAIYGMSSVKSKKQINLVISIENWSSNENYERLGIDKDYIEILNTEVEKLTLPVRPGRNIAVIIEAAAANYRYSYTSNITAVDTIEKRMNELNNSDF
ncbi:MULTISPECIES: HPr(Ser) kinase/phosphatase [unclassified Clostridium]|uniref:HPr(Ser) kinase/phosphatase n=1 Tax=unclassified Clostridium TaxID=2614128 RepID=UPI000ED2CA31|nr:MULTISPECIES: HPr(Ser) kinase/phosphatase [unclassified Clostridium]HCQ90827.1 HPr kinase/phosphorylase [Clostridium sp.]